MCNPAPQAVFWGADSPTSDPVCMACPGGGRHPVIRPSIRFGVSIGVFTVSSRWNFKLRIQTFICIPCPSLEKRATICSVPIVCQALYLYILLNSHITLGGMGTIVPISPRDACDLSRIQSLKSKACKRTLSHRHGHVSSPQLLPFWNLDCQFINLVLDSPGSSTLVPQIRNCHLQRQNRPQREASPPALPMTSDGEFLQPFWTPQKHFHPSLA